MNLMFRTYGTPENRISEDPNDVKEPERRHDKNVLRRVSHTRLSIMPFLECEEMDPLKERQKSRLKLLDALAVDGQTKMDQALSRYRISKKGMPTGSELYDDWLSETTLDQALKLKAPVLLLKPPLTPQELVRAMNKYPTKDQSSALGFVLNDNSFWLRSRPENVNGWEVKIVEGLHELDSPPIMKEKDIIIFDKVRSCCQDYHDERLGVIGDISTYLLLMMVSLSEGRPIDTLGRTIVNAINLTEKTPIITGFWEDGGVRFSTDNNPHDLYVRGLINVKKKSPIPALTA